MKILIESKNEGKKKMSKKETAKRYVLFIISLFFSALGVAFTKHGELGVSPISSVANVLSCTKGGFSLGVWLIIWNCILILGQILILRKKFQLIQLLQIPLAFLVMVVVGIVILGFGVSLSVSANVIMNSGEAFVKAIADTANKNFGNVKIAFDVSCVVLAVILSLLLFDFTIVGTREGTVISALCTGLAVKLFQRLTNEPVNRLVSD